MKIVPRLWLGFGLELVLGLGTSFPRGQLSYKQFPCTFLAFFVWEERGPNEQKQTAASSPCSGGPDLLIQV